MPYQGGRHGLVGIISMVDELSARAESGVKFYLTLGQELRLLYVRTRRNLIIVRSDQPTEYANMNAINLIARFGQAAFAVMVTTASVLVFQLALLAG